MAKLDKLRSQRWLDRNDFRSFNHRSRVMQMGYDPKDWEGKPVIAILNNWSDYNPCHQHFKHRVDEVKRGVLMAGVTRDVYAIVIEGTPGAFATGGDLGEFLRLLTAADPDLAAVGRDRHPVGVARRIDGLQQPGRGAARWCSANHAVM